MAYGVCGITLGPFVALMVGWTGIWPALPIAVLVLAVGFVSAICMSEAVTSLFEGIGLGMLAPILSYHLGVLAPVDDYDPELIEIFPWVLVVVGAAIGVNVIHNALRRHWTSEHGLAIPYRR
jgi:hypothetical protein